MWFFSKIRYICDQVYMCFFWKIRYIYMKISSQWVGIYVFLPRNQVYMWLLTNIGYISIYVIWKSEMTPWWYCTEGFSSSFPIQSSQESYTKKRLFFSSDRIFARIALKFFMHKLQTILLLLDTKNFVKLHRSSEIQPLEVEGYGPKNDLKKVNAGYFPVFLTCSDR